MLHLLIKLLAFEMSKLKGERVPERQEVARRSSFNCMADVESARCGLMMSYPVAFKIPILPASKDEFAQVLPDNVLTSQTQQDRQASPEHNLGVLLKIDDGHQEYADYGHMPRRRFTDFGMSRVC
ncbi:hypothetical protein ACS0TY_036001 [Phlomoides rotata]